MSRLDNQPMTAQSMIGKRVVITDTYTREFAWDDGTGSTARAEQATGLIGTLVEEPRELSTLTGYWQLRLKVEELSARLLDEFWCDPNDEVLEIIAVKFRVIEEEM